MWTRQDDVREWARVGRLVLRRTAALLALLSLSSIAHAQTDRRPVYVGVEVCASCHDTEPMGRQATKWLSTKHAHAFESLLKPEARRIARISGVPIEPTQSPLCLGCHATGANAEESEKDDTFQMRAGVQCEKCHGPGSEHVAFHSGDPLAVGVKAAMTHYETSDCLKCHADKPSHTTILGPRRFDPAQAMAAIAHPATPGGRVAQPSDELSPALRAYLEGLEAPLPAARADAPVLDDGEPVYKTPIHVVFRPDGKEAYVTCEAAGTVCVIDPATRLKVAEIPVGRQPMSIAFAPDGSLAYVTNRLDDSVSVVDVQARKAVATIPVGDEPHGLALDPTGQVLLVLNTSSDDISVIDLAARQETRRLSASRSPWGVALSPDGSRFVVTNALSRLAAPEAPPLSEITLIEAARGRVEDRLLVPGANLVQAVAWHPGGAYALVTLNRTKNRVPMTQMAQGWTITNGLGIVRPDLGRVDQVLLDEPTLSFPDPTDLAFTPDGSRALVTSAGSDRVAVVETSRLLKIVDGASPHDRDEVIPNHLGPATEFVAAHIATGRNPRGIAVAPDGQTALVACALDDTVQVIDLGSLTVTATIDLEGPRTITQARYGERLFNSANISFRRQLSCHSCHPDGHVDGLTYDIEADGIGVSPVDNRTLRGILDTGPFKWEGTNPTLSRQCGPRLSVYFTRIQPFTPEELAAVDHYITTIPRPPNRYRPLGAALTPAQRRGKTVFERTAKADGSPIAVEKRCVSCHFPPLYTDRQRHVVGAIMPNDTQNRFDAPHLNNIYDSAPYLHNGAARSLEEIWTVYNPNDEHGQTNDLTKDQLNDLVEYLKTL
jgi:YVTN family beta-propeller protein